MRKLIRRLITLVILAGLATGFYFYGRNYLWPSPQLGAIRTVGVIEAQEVNVTSRIAGRIAELSLVEGDAVKRGQVVCRIEDTDLQNLHRKAVADLAHDRAVLDDARRTANRDVELYKQNIIATQTRDDALAALDESQASVLSAEANVKYYEDQLRDTQIVAPTDGIVASKAMEVGEWVNPGTPIITLDDMSQIWARVDVQETDLGSIRMGQPAQVSLPGQPPIVLSGQVMSIGQEGQFATEHDVRRGRQDIRTFWVKVRVFQDEGALKPGLTAEVEFNRRDGRKHSSGAGSDHDRAGTQRDSRREAD